MTRIAFMSTYPPRRCGIGTYTQQLRRYVNASLPCPGGHPVVVMSTQETDVPMGNLYWPLLQDRRDAYTSMAERLNRSDVSVVSLQHEFGIFGGESGAYILDFIEALKKPLVTTFHTVFPSPEEPYRHIQQALAIRSDAIVSMSRRGVEYLKKAFRVSADKVAYIPHGTPLPPSQDREILRNHLGWQGRQVILTFGLLSRGKGIESMLDSLSTVVEQVPEVLYIVAGQTHPEVRKWEGESYRRELQTLIKEKNLSNHVLMLDRYLEDADLVRMIAACDLYVTPYPGMEQSTSGTLAYAVGIGRPVLSTPYIYARDLLQGYEDLLIPYGDTQTWAKRLTELLTQPEMLAEWGKRIAKIGLGMHWPQIGRQYAKLFARVTMREQQDSANRLISSTAALPAIGR